MHRAQKTNHIFQDATKHWKYVAPLLAYPKNDSEYNLLVQRLDQLLDIVKDNENHPFIGLVEIMSNIIAVYDENHFQVKGNSIETLKYLMELNQLKQTDLHDIGSQGVVSEILNGKRKLNLRQIAILAKLFDVDPSTFID